jgi:hypothetical protein
METVFIMNRSKGLAGEVFLVVPRIKSTFLTRPSPFWAMRTIKEESYLRGEEERSFGPG